MFDHDEKVAHFRFLRSPSSFFVRLRCNQLSNLAFTTTAVEDTHLALAVIAFKEGTNNFLIFCYYKHTRKKLPIFRFCSAYNSLLSNCLGLKVALTPCHRGIPDGTGVVHPTPMLSPVTLHRHTRIW